MGDYAGALVRGEEALKIARTEGDGHVAAQALRGLGWTRLMQGDPRGGLALVGEGLAMARALGDWELAAASLNVRGTALYQLGEDGRASWEEALELFHQMGNRMGLATVLNNIATGEIDTGRLTAARRHLDEALHLARELGDREAVSFALVNLGLAIHQDGDDITAREMFTETLDIARSIRYHSQGGYALLGVALTSTNTGGLQRAATLHGVVDALLEQLGEQLQALELRLHDADQVRLRKELGDVFFENVYRAGRVLTLDEAIVLALS